MLIHLFSSILICFLFLFPTTAECSTSIALSYDSSTKTLSGTTTLTSSTNSVIYSRDLREISSDFPVGSTIKFQINKAALNFTPSKIKSDFVYTEAYEPTNTHTLATNIAGKCSKISNPNICESCKILQCLPPSKRGNGEFCLVYDPDMFYSVITPSDFVYTLDLTSQLQLGENNLPIVYNLTDSHLTASFSKNFASAKFVIKFADDITEYDKLSSKTFFIYKGNQYLLTSPQEAVLNTFKSDWEMETCSGTFGSRTEFFSNLSKFTNSNETTLSGKLGASFLKFTGTLENVAQSAEILLQKDVFIQFSIYLE